jgi:hypothetical protein
MDLTAADEADRIADQALTDSVLSAATGDADAAEFQRDFADELRGFAAEVRGSGRTLPHRY